MGLKDTAVGGACVTLLAHQRRSGTSFLLLTSTPPSGCVQHSIEESAALHEIVLNVVLLR